MRNFALATTRHRVFADTTSTNVEELPITTWTEDKAPKTTTDANDDNYNPTQTDSDVAPSDDDNDTMKTTTVPSQLQTGKHAQPLSTWCGALPHGCDVDTFHDVPSREKARSAEAKYLREFAAQLRDALPTETTSPDLAMPHPQWAPQGTDALIASQQQQCFFKSVDKYHIDPHMSTHSRTTQKNNIFDNMITSHRNEFAPDINKTITHSGHRSSNLSLVGRRSQHCRCRNNQRQTSACTIVECRLASGIYERAMERRLRDKEAAWPHFFIRCFHAPHHWSRRHSQNRCLASDRGPHIFPGLTLCGSSLHQTLLPDCSA